MKVLFVGDSIFKGDLGYSPVSYISKNIEIVNLSINGDSITGVLNRLKEQLEKDNKFDYIVIKGGLNDIHIPFCEMCGYSTRVDNFANTTYCVTEEEFKFTFKEICKELKIYQTLNRITPIIVTMPVTEIKDWEYETQDKFIKIQKEVAEEFNIKYIDSQAVLKKEIGLDLGEFDYMNISNIIEYFRSKVFPFTKDLMGKWNGLNYTVDGLHLNSTSAKIIAKEIEKYFN